MRDIQRVGGFAVGKFKNLAEDVGDPQIARQAGEQRQSATDLDLFQRDCFLGLGKPGLGKRCLTLIEVLPETPEAQTHGFGPTLLAQFDQMAAGNSQCPATCRCGIPQGAEIGDNPDQDFLRRILRTVRVGQHAQREIVDRPLGSAH